jgi:hypothetical protein
MSPIRHEEDFRRIEIEDWDTWIEEQIQESQERGEFDNLPHAGKPIEIYRTQLNPEYDLAFSRMKNAGVLPAWMELDRDVARMSQDLDAFLDRSVAWLLSERDAIIRARQTENSGPAETLPQQRPWWQVWQRLLDWFRFDPVDTRPGWEPRSLGDLLRLRDHIRVQYLERAAELDKKIEVYHNTLPQGLSHLQRLRMLPARAEKRFEARLPARALFLEPIRLEEDAEIAS